jgi:hypothetical protein
MLERLVQKLQNNLCFWEKVIEVAGIKPFTKRFKICLKSV